MCYTGADWTALCGSVTIAPNPPLVPAVQTNILSSYKRQRPLELLRLFVLVHSVKGSSWCKRAQAARRLSTAASKPSRGTRTDALTTTRNSPRYPVVCKLLPRLRLRRPRQYQHPRPSRILSNPRRQNGERRSRADERDRSRRPARNTAPLVNPPRATSLSPRSRRRKWTL